MSPSEDDPTPASEIPEPEAPNQISKVPEGSKPETSSQASEAPRPKAAREDSEKSKPSSEKKLSKSARVMLLVIGWILLLGVGAGAAFIIKPTPEVVYTDAIIEAYKFSKQDAAKVTNTVDDLDYYGYYTSNPLAFSRINEGKAKGAYTISGLKNKTVESKINDRIVQAASALYDAYSESDIYMDITANYFNVLSFSIQHYDGNEQTWRREYVTFDLNTGEKLHFDDLFSDNINLTSLLFNAFYHKLATDIQFGKLRAELRLMGEEDYPDPSKCDSSIVYCPLPGETYDSIRALIADYDDQMTNIEQLTINTIQDYLAGEKKFYLVSSGPVFVLSDDTTVGVELKENIRYAIYLKNYRSQASLFEDDSIATPNLFFTDAPSLGTEYFKEETDTYLFSYIGGKRADDFVSPEIQRTFLETIKEKGLSASGDTGKFRYISAIGSISQYSKIRTGSIFICAYETDKPYYDSTFRKSIVNGELNYARKGPSQRVHYDTNRVAEVSVKNDSGIDYCEQQRQVAVTDAGTVIEDIDGILINPPNREGWEDYLKHRTYSEICYGRPWDPKCYTEEERKDHKLSYTFTGSGVDIGLDDGSESDYPVSVYINIEDIPLEFFNPEILVK